MDAGWTSFIDHESGDPYFYNERTGATSWDFPASAATTAAGSVPPSYRQRPPPGWAEYEDPVKGLYWHNAATDAYDFERIAF
jgi:hypothetical protein